MLLIVKNAGRNKLALVKMLKFLSKEPLSLIQAKNLAESAPFQVEIHDARNEFLELVKNCDIEYELSDNSVRKDNLIALGIAENDFIIDSILNKDIMFLSTSKSWDELESYLKFIYEFLDKEQLMQIWQNRVQRIKEERIKKKQKDTTLPQSS